MTKLIDPNNGGGKLAEHLNSSVQTVLLVFFHGIGDVLMFRHLLAVLRSRYPAIKFDLGIGKGLGGEKLVRDAVFIEGEWQTEVLEMGYDLVFLCHFPMEDVNNPNLTKAEQCCIQELGIPPTSGHPLLVHKPLVTCHFQMTSLPGMANVSEELAKQIWSEIVECGFTPFETLFEHCFHNPVNARYPWVDNHVRNCTPNVDTLVSLIGSSFAFVGVASGNFHVALSVLPPGRVMLLENQIKRGNLTKLPIAVANVERYRGQVKAWLEVLKNVSVHKN
jgi:hypothetical protein